MVPRGPWLEPGGFRGIERFLLPSERRVIAVRRHWARLLEPADTAVLALVLLLWLDQALPLVPDVRQVVLAGWVVLLARLTWKLLHWRADWFVVTDRRRLLRSGLITRQVAMMPLIKVTDMSYARPPLGRLLGYGQIVIESAGHGQALRRITHLPDRTGSTWRCASCSSAPERRSASAGPEPRSARLMVMKVCTQDRAPVFMITAT